MSGPVAESKALAGRLSQLEDENKLGVIQEVVIPGVNAGAAFPIPPAEYFERDARDDYYQAKREVTRTAAAGAGAGVGNKVEITDEDIKYLLDQRTKEELYNYDAWFYQTFQPGSDPNKLALYREMNPSWFARREAEINKQIEIAKKLAKLGLRGPRTDREVELMYAIDTGRVQIPDLDYLFPEKARIKGGIAAYNESRAVNQGFFNPRKFTNSRVINTRTLSAAAQPFIAGGRGGAVVAPLAAGQRAGGRNFDGLAAGAPGGPLHGNTALFRNVMGRT